MNKYLNLKFWCYCIYVYFINKFKLSCKLTVSKDNTLNI